MSLDLSLSPLPPYFDELNPPQREAVLCTEGALIVLAGAGSGKTRMLTSRMAWLVEGKSISPHHILAVTFTNKAAAEMKERVEKFLKRNWNLPEIGTFHSICGRLLRREAHLLPFTKPYVIYDDSDQLSLIKNVMERIGIDTKAFNPKSVQGAINRAKCDAFEPEDLKPETHDVYGRQVKKIYELYQRELFQNNAVDFGEMICMSYRLLRDHPEVRKKYQNHYQYLLVDEYQDTNRAQYLFLSMLASGQEGGHQNICVVGDEDQSIYRWRGADIRNILEFEKDYPGAKLVKLEQNYRSTQTIVSAASQLISNNRSRKKKTLWTQNKVGEKIKKVQVGDDRTEAEYVVSEIKRHCINEGRSYKDFAIFYRTHAQSRQFEDLLRREKITYQIIGGLRFYDRKEIKDILAYFKLLLNPDDSVSLKRVINVPARGIGKTTLEKLDTFAGQQGLSFWEALLRASQDANLTSMGTSRKLASFVRLIQKLMAERAQLKLSELYHLILDETGYVSELKTEATEESLTRVDNLEEFDNLISEFEAETLGDENAPLKEGIDLLTLFLERTTLQTDMNDPDQVRHLEGPSVHLMTLHSSKGLEYPVVFLPGLEEGLFPSCRPWEEAEEEELEEERRLCYVGMTRAREVLYLLHAQARRMWGTLTYQEPSRFFQEIPEDFIDEIDLSLGYSKPRAVFNTFGSLHSTRALQPVQSQERTTFKKTDDSLIGCRVDHPDYGAGAILSVDGSGDLTKVIIEFKQREQKKFLLRYIRPYMRSYLEE